MSDLEDNSPVSPPLDNPIKTSKEDALGRASVAHDLALSIRNLDASEGVVAAVLGPWGNGKSSFVNLMREQFAEDPALTVIDFNPWVFSGTRSLTDVFFTEIAAELRLKDGNKFDAIAEGLDEYGDVLSPLAIIPGFGAGGIGRLNLLGRLRRGGRNAAREVPRSGTKSPKPYLVSTSR